VINDNDTIFDDDDEDDPSEIIVFSPEEFIPMTEIIAK